MRKLFTTIFALFLCAVSIAQNIAVESFAKDETDLVNARIANRKDQNGKVCALVKIETSLQSKDMSFDFGTTGKPIRTEQKVGEIWLFTPVGARFININHNVLGVIRAYQFGYSLEEATVYVMKLRSGTVKPVVEDYTPQFFVVTCSIEGATIKIDNDAPIPFDKGRFERTLSLGKHDYMVEAPLYYPLVGKAEIVANQSTTINADELLDPKFAQFTVTSQPETGADVFIDEVRHGQTPLTVEKLSSGVHSIRVVKNMYLPAEQQITIKDREPFNLPLTLIPNFAEITLVVPNGGDIFVNNNQVGTGRWSGRLASGGYKVEVKKASHRSTVEAIEVEARKAQTFTLRDPAPITGILRIESGNVTAEVYIDGVKQPGVSPVILNNILTGQRMIEFRARGYKPKTEYVTVEEGKTVSLKPALAEEDKFATLYITANTIAEVWVDGVHQGRTTPTEVRNVPLGRKAIKFAAYGYKDYTTSVAVDRAQRYEVYGTLKAKPIIEPLWFMEYRYSRTAPFGLSIGYCERWGGYLTAKWDGGVSFVEEMEPAAPGYSYDYGYYEGMDFDSNNRKYVRVAITGGAMVRLASWLYLSGGLGYGTYGAAYHITSSENDYYCPDLQKGLEVEAGVTVPIKAFNLSVGYCTIISGNSQRFADIQIGVGINF